MKMIKYIKSYFSLKVVGIGFTDAVSGKTVCYYEDCYGAVYMKDSRWSIFRVLVKESA